ncbi:tRNA (adenosine(37)-N6)-threonylcarbamoyltransferase complex dimerization subunit type 1 TsaB [Chungangia koreensis]|uniref:tRNA (Adenosine(37)-N6)-threonylcarbamoyltransferase complex dimerization subunit type 1 TsaB n=1 Tax=Chungangia koreensis TaxID=752657 RepID=A0ABV8X2J8_9LACT
MIWLGIDTSNYPLSVAIVQDNRILVEETTNLKLNHSIATMPTVEEVFRKAGLKPKEIDAIAVAEGPGSYTGIRIGVTIAKTLAWTLQKPLVGVSSIQSIAANALRFNGVICPIMDARRGNVYSGAYRAVEGSLQEEVKDGHYALDDLLTRLLEANDPVLFLGTDVAIHWEKIEQRLGTLAVRGTLTEDLPRATSLIYLAAQEYNGEGENIHHFVPQYRRIAEAEANWLKDQQKAGNSNA